MFMFLVKLTRLPKFIGIGLAASVNTFGVWIPAISCIGSLIVWMIALVFTVIPLHHVLGVANPRESPTASVPTASAAASSLPLRGGGGEKNTGGRADTLEV